MTLDISVMWVIGLAMAVARTASFIAFCAFVPRTIPKLGRTALALAAGLLIAQPLASPTLSSADLVVMAFTNITLGSVLGWFFGLFAFTFQVAGTVVDLSSGISLGSVFDPDSGSTPGPLSRFYTLSAQALIIAAGGIAVLIQVLWASTKVIALDGKLSGLGFLGTEAQRQVSELFRVGVELALPIASVLFVAEISFGLLSRLAPQINMFLIALPVKTLMALSMLGTAAAIFPRYADNAIHAGLASVSRMLGH